MRRLGLALRKAFIRKCTNRQERKSIKAMDVEFKAIFIEIILISTIIFSLQSFITVESIEGYSSILDNISTQRIVDNTKRLVDFKTRYIFTPECNASAAFLHDYFSRLGGYDVYFDYFRVTRRASENFTAMNVVASKRGVAHENETIIVCAHYDSISEFDPVASAPGANDNAAGVAVVMEVAYVLGVFSLNRTVIFIAFSSEELSLQGSMNWVTNNTEILKSTIGIICLDGVARGKTIAVMFTLEASDSLARYVVNTARKLGYENFYERQVGAVGSDSDSFEMKGVRAVRFWDWDTTFIHTPDDTLETLDVNCIKQVADVACVATYRLATEPLDGVLTSIGRGASEGFLILVGAVVASVIVVISLLLIRNRRVLKQRLQSLIVFFILWLIG